MLIVCTNKEKVREMNAIYIVTPSHCQRKKKEKFSGEGPSYDRIPNRVTEERPGEVTGPPEPHPWCCRYSQPRLLGIQSILKVRSTCQVLLYFPASLHRFLNFSSQTLLLHLNIKRSSFNHTLFHNTIIIHLPVREKTLE